MTVKDADLEKMAEDLWWEANRMLCNYPAFKKKAIEALQSVSRRTRKETAERCVELLHAPFGAWVNGYDAERAIRKEFLKEDENGGR